MGREVWQWQSMGSQESNLTEQLNQIFVKVNKYLQFLTLGWFTKHCPGKKPLLWKSASEFQSKCPKAFDLGLKTDTAVFSDQDVFWYSWLSSPISSQRPLIVPRIQLFWKINSYLMEADILHLLFNVPLSPASWCVVCSVASIVSDSLQPMHHSLPGSSVQGIFPTRILQWVTMTSSGESSRPRNWTCISCIADGFFTCWAIGESPPRWYYHPYFIEKTRVQILTQSLIAKKWKSLGFQTRSDSKIHAPSPLQKRGRITTLNLFSSSIIRFMVLLILCHLFAHKMC